MQGRWCVAVGAIALTTLAVPVMAAGQQVDGDEVLLDDIGPGWSPTECPPVAQPSGPSVCFAADARAGELLSISATRLPSGVDSGSFVEILATGLGGQPFETPGLVIAEGLDTSQTGETQLTIVMAAGDSVFNLNLIRVLSPSSAEAKALLLDVALRQQDQAGRPSEVPDTQGGAGDGLDPLLLTPPSGSGFEIMATGDIPVDVADLRSEARSQAVFDLLNKAPARMRIFSVDGIPVVFVTLSEQPYGVFAATELGSVADLPADRRITLDPEPVPDAVGFRLPPGGGGGVGIAFRKGRYAALVITPSLGIDEADALPGLMELAKLQADLLPEGETAPYFFPSMAKSIAVTGGLTTVICGGALGVGRLAAARGRRRTRAHAPRNETATIESRQIFDVTQSGAALRRRGLALTVVDLVAVNAVVAGTLGATGVLQLPFVLSVTLLAAGALGGILFTAWWARSEIRRTRPGDAFARELRPSMLGAVGALVALAMLAVGLAFAADGLGGLAFGPSLSGLERSQRFGVDPALLSLAALVVSVILLVMGGFAFRLARIWARTSAERLRARDRRPPSCTCDLSRTTF